MKLSNYLVLLLALVFLGGMTGCGKGNSAGGGESNVINSNPPLTNTGTPTNNGSYESIIADIENGRFAAPKSSASEFVFDTFSSSSSSSSLFTITCSGFSAGWCDNSSSDIADYVFFRRMTSESTIDARESKDVIGLPTDLNGLRAHLASLAKNALSMEKAVNPYYNHDYSRKSFISKVNFNNNALMFRVGTGSEYKIYYIDLRYPLAAQPVRVDTIKYNTLRKFLRLRYEL